MASAWWLFMTTQRTRSAYIIEPTVRERVGMRHGTCGVHLTQSAQGARAWCCTTQGSAVLGGCSTQGRRRRRCVATAATFSLVLASVDACVASSPLASCRTTTPRWRTGCCLPPKRSGVTGRSRRCQRGHALHPHQTTIPSPACPFPRARPPAPSGAQRRGPWRETRHTDAGAAPVEGGTPIAAQARHAPLALPAATLQPPRKPA